MVSLAGDLCGFWCSLFSNYSTEKVLPPTLILTLMPTMLHQHRRLQNASQCRHVAGLGRVALYEPLLMVETLMVTRGDMTKVQVIVQGGLLSVALLNWSVPFEKHPKSRNSIQLTRTSNPTLPTSSVYLD